jgi:hypothetical protein
VRYCGVRAAVVVLADRIGCRSRQAARGRPRPCAKSAWTTRDGLASRRESAGEVKERRKPARPAAKRRVRWRALYLIGNGRRESARQGAPVDRRRLGPNQIVRVDERAMEAVLVLADLGKPRSTETTGDVRGRSRSVIGEENTPVGRASQTWTPRRRAPRKRTRRHRVATGPSWPAPSSARPTGVGLSQDGPAPRRTNAGRYSGLRLRVPARGRACGVSATQVVRSVIERFSGARIVSRLQRSVRSIFPVPPRRAERQTKAVRDSAIRRRVRDEGESIESGNKGARTLRANVKGIARLFARPQGRESS